MLEFFVIIPRRLLLNIEDQSRSLDTAVSALSTFFISWIFLRLWSVHYSM